jgi:NAD(P)-dependent dehydrogenase (short-subunit alcohol dehydrogenase family)
MKLQEATVVVTGGGSGLGEATARRLATSGATVCVIDLAPSDGAPPDHVAAYASADVADEAALSDTFTSFGEQHGPIRGVVHCAGRGGDRVRILDKDGNAAPLDTFAEVIKVNLFGTYNVLRLGAREIARAEPIDGERGAIVLTASVAAFDGQIGQTSYTASKAAVHGITLVAARDLGSRLIRVNTIAPGVFDTPMLSRLRADIREALEASVPNPSRLGGPDDYAHMAAALLENSYVNGETVRLDGAIRMPPR